MVQFQVMMHLYVAHCRTKLKKLQDEEAKSGLPALRTFADKTTSK
jgi:hypothetical protein